MADYKYLYWFGKRGKDRKVLNDIYVSIIYDESGSYEREIVWKEKDIRMKVPVMDIIIDPFGEVPGRKYDGTLMRTVDVRPGKILCRSFWLPEYNMEKAQDIVNQYLGLKEFDYRRAFNKLVVQIKKERAWAYDDKTQKEHKWEQTYFKGMQDAYNSIETYANMLIEGRIK